jgi:hypothetical protein
LIVLFFIRCNLLNKIAYFCVVIDDDDDDDDWIDFVFVFDL